jgi:hypothetical protein
MGEVVGVVVLVEKAVRRTKTDHTWQSIARRSLRA